jgi:oligoendopeptidase F
MKYRTEWNLALLYKNNEDPQIEKDIEKFEKICADFEKKYKGKDFASNPKKLIAALNEYMVIQNPDLAKPWCYFALQSEINSDNSFAGAKATQIEERITQATNKTLFFILEIGKIPSVLQKSFLVNKNLILYKYMLERIFQEAKYNLSEKEEQLAGLLSQSSYSMWVNGQQRILDQKTVLFKGANIPISEAEESLPKLPQKERHELYNKIIALYKENSAFAEAEINAIVTYKKVMDERRGFKKPYSSRLLEDEIDEKTLNNLVTIVTKYFSISKKFYKLHAKLLNQKTLTRADRRVAFGKINKKFTFEESIDIVKTAFSNIDKKYADLMESFVDKGQFDVYPKKGKTSGAFCWSMGTLPTFILINHVNNLRSVEAIAHEMGHAIHGELSNRQPLQYRSHSTATAEVASTFFEQVGAVEISKTLNEEEQMSVIHSRLMNDIGCIFSQIAGFNYEVELHDKIAQNGQINRGEIAALLKKHYDSFSGKAMTINDDDGYGFVAWSHTRMFFYIYSYAYGQLVSRSLYEKWKADPSYAKKIEQFLSAGRSMSPKDIFKSIGITTNEAFFEAGLKGIEADIIKLEKLAKKYKKI